MKNMLKIAFAAVALIAVGVSAEEPTTSAKLSDFSVGDTIVIKRDHRRYLTGELMSTWVYNVEHTIQQVGGKRWPNGILIRGIYSWVGPDDILNKSTHPQLAEENQEAKREDEKKVAEETPIVVVEETPAVQEEVTPAPVVVVEETPAAQEEVTPAPVVVVEETPAVQEEVTPAPVVVVEETPAVQEEVTPAPVVVVEETPAAQEEVTPAPVVVEEEVTPAPVVVVVEETPVVQEETPAVQVEVTPVVAEETTKEKKQLGPAKESLGVEAVTEETENHPEIIPQCDRFSIGARAGLASLMHDAGKMGKWHAGFDALLDLQYAHYWKKDAWRTQYGILVGLSAGYSRSHIESAIKDQFSERTADGQIDYTIQADKVKEYDGQIQLEVPVMFSMIHDCGLFFNFGPRFAVPVYAHYDQKISSPDIIAHFPEEDVTVYNAKITGQVTDDQAKSKGKWSASKINIMLGAELGYEVRFPSQNSLGIGVYANYSVYTLYTNNTDKASLVTINELPAANKPAVVNVLSATDTYNQKLGYFDVGLKLAYHFNRIRKNSAWIQK